MTETMSDATQGASWPRDYAACPGTDCPVSTHCKRHLGHLIAKWEGRSGQATLLTPTTPGEQCPSFLSVEDAREQNVMRSLIGWRTE